MARIVLQDAGPTGLVICPTHVSGVMPCREWLADIEESGVEVLMPTIVEYAVRRELMRINAKAKLRALDELVERFESVAVSAAANRQAAPFWAVVRQAGKPTADPKALDVDTIIAGVAATIGESWDEVTVATTNVGHFARFSGIDAKEWHAIA